MVIHMMNMKNHTDQNYIDDFFRLFDAEYVI
jgi:hypothetical protein